MFDECLLLEAYINSGQFNDLSAVYASARNDRLFWVTVQVGLSIKQTAQPKQENESKMTGSSRETILKFAQNQLSIFFI